MWRILIGFGAVLGLHYRQTIPESSRYFLDVNMEFTPAAIISKGNVTLLQVNSDLSTRPSDVNTLDGQYASLKSSEEKLPSRIFVWKYGKILLGTAGSWFAVDITLAILKLSFLATQVHRMFIRGCITLLLVS